jgi:hypothetical protein
MGSRTNEGGGGQNGEGFAGAVIPPRFFPAEVHNSPAQILSVDGFSADFGDRSAAYYAMAERIDADRFRDVMKEIWL